MIQYIKNQIKQNSVMSFTKILREKNPKPQKNKDHESQGNK